MIVKKFDKEVVVPFMSISLFPTTDPPSIAAFEYIRLTAYAYLVVSKFIYVVNRRYVVDTQICNSRLPTTCGNDVPLYPSVLDEFFVRSHTDRGDGFQPNTSSS